MMISMRKAMSILAAIWLILGLGFLAIVIVQSIMGVYGDKADDAFAWLLPTLMPTLMLIMGVVAAEAAGQTARKRRVDLTMLVIAIGVSIFYLIIVSLTVLLAPLSPSPPLELMIMSNLWLGPLQGLTGAALGVFFVRKEPQPSQAIPAPATPDAKE